MNKWLPDGKVFILFGTCALAAALYTFIYVKETKGLSEAELKRLYRPKDEK